VTGYHEFVFNQAERRFIGEFEEMYQQEQVSCFDSWHQDDLRSREDAAAIMRVVADQHFDWLVDLGCGKGALTSALSNVADRSLGVDVSPTAIRIAQERYPHLDFLVADINDASIVRQVLRSLKQTESKKVLVVLSQVLSYLSQWREVVAAVSQESSEFLVGLYLPIDPIGFVKSRDELESVIKDSANILSWHESAATNQHVVHASTGSSR